MKLYLEAGHGGTDPGAIGHGGVTEASLTLELRNGITAALRSSGYKGSIIHDPDNANLAAAIAAFKPSANDLLVGLHFNAGPRAATGTEVIVANRPNELELKVAGELAGAMGRVLGIPVRSGTLGKGIRAWHETARGARGVSSGWLGMPGNNLIVEVCFITNSGDLGRYNERKEELWKAMAEVLMSHLTQRR